VVVGLMRVDSMGFNKLAVRIYAAVKPDLMSSAMARKIFTNNCCHCSPIYALQTNLPALCSSLLGRAKVAVHPKRKNTDTDI